MEGMKRIARLALVPVLLVGCRSSPSAEDPDPARVRELEARVRWLEAQVRLAEVDDELLELQLQRAEMLVTYEPDHPAVLHIEFRIDAVERVRGLEGVARRDAMRLRLEAQREILLGTYAPEHPSVQKIDAKIAFLRSGAG